MRLPADRPAAAPPATTTWVARDAVFPGIVNGLAAVAYAAASSFVPLWAREVGLQNSGLFFIVFAGTIVLVRPLAGRVSDRGDRRITVLPGLFLCGLAMVVLAAFASVGGILAAGAVFGVAWGLLIPGITAFALDRSPGGRRGASMGTFTAFVDLGIGGGAYLIGALVDGFGYRNAFALVSIPGFVACVAFAIGARPSRPAEAVIGD
jgi:MFS family permease